MSVPLLSLILCTRNDQYMGNARWRLETVLDRTCDAIGRQGWGNDVEIIVSDWGSEQPLSGVLRLSEAARRIVRFLHVPPALAIPLQKDSPFPEVLALNAAARRCRGRYIGRIDNDTVIAPAFFRRFFRLLDKPISPFDPARAFLFIQRRCVPFEFASMSPSQRAVKWLIGGLGPLLPVERINKPNHFFQSPVGIMLLHRDIWSECGGYDESLLYWGWMECDLAFRLMQKYPAVDLGRHIGRSLFHLEHYNAKAPRTVSRKCNPMRRDNQFRPNGDEWGLRDMELSLSPAAASRRSPEPKEFWITTLRQIARALPPLPRMHVKWISRDWPFSLILFEPKTGHLRRRFRPPRPGQSSGASVSEGAPKLHIASLIRR